MRTVSRDVRRLRDWIALSLLLASCLVGTGAAFSWILTLDEGVIEPKPSTLIAFLMTLSFLFLAFYASSYPRPILLYLRKFGEGSDGSPFARAAKQQTFRDYRIVTLHNERSNPCISDDSAYFVIALIMIALWGMAMARASDSVAAWLGFLGFLGVPFTAKAISLLLEVIWAEKYSLAVRCCEDLKNVVEQVGRWRDRGNWLVIRRISNIAVAEAQWKEAVSRFAVEAQVILIDISTLAPGIAWEAGLALQHFSEKTIFLTQEQAVAEANIAEVAGEALEHGRPNIVTIGNEPAEARRSIQKLCWMLR